MFDDFDIDFNQQKYLLETRVSGALTKVKSAMVVTSTTVQPA
jgi:prohead protease